MYKIIGADKNEYGPASAEELRQWIQQGRANAESLIREEGAIDWRPLGTFAEFAGALAAKRAADAAPAPGEFLVRAPASRTNAMAMTGFIFSLLGLPCCAVGIFSLLGLIFSIIGMVQVGRDPSQGGRGMAKAGLIISIVTLLILIVCVVLGAWFDVADKINDL